MRKAEVLRPIECLHNNLLMAQISVIKTNFHAFHSV